jgi:hypothetical protein
METDPKLLQAINELTAAVKEVAKNVDSHNTEMQSIVIALRQISHK